MPKTQSCLVLASQSPRRRELLEQIGFKPLIRPSDIDETPLATETASDYVERMAREKALACSIMAESEVILAADTVVVLDGEILGKPLNRADAAAMLERLSHRSHQVMTAVALRRGNELKERRVVSDVTFAELDAAQIHQYLLSGEADDKAGSYGIQGRAAKFVTHVSGSYSSVVGLPLYEVAVLLRDWGVAESDVVEK